MILDSSLKVCFVMLENFCTFVTYYILEGRETCQSLTGIFYACTLHIRRFRIPVRSVNAPAAFEGVVQRDERNRLFYSLQQNFLL